MQQVSSRKSHIAAMDLFVVLLSYLHDFLD